MLREELSSLPRREREEQLRFYSELIDDRMEDGWSEKAAIARLGAPNRLASRILRDANEESEKKHSSKRSRFSPFTITLLILGSPIWLSLLLSFYAVIFSLLVSLWAVMICLYAVGIGIVGCGIGGIAGGILFCLQYPLTGIALLGCGLLCLGMSIWAVKGCALARIGFWSLTKKTGSLFILPFRRKETAA